MWQFFELGAKGAHALLLVACLVSLNCAGFEIVESEVSDCDDDYESGMVDPSATITTGTGQFEVSFLAAMNCCGPEINFERFDSELRVSWEEGDNPCDCFCLYEARYVIEIEAGDYTLVFVGDDWANGRREYEFTVPGG